MRPAEVLARIKSLAIPPAWTNVWICASANGHIQATGRDACGRKQYRYHSRWRAVRDESKYEHLLEFGQALPAIRRIVGRSFEGPRESSGSLIRNPPCFPIAVNRPYLLLRASANLLGSSIQVRI